MVYINGRGCVSAQPTFDGRFPGEVIFHQGHVLPVVAPVYKDFIAPAQIRRMGSGVKNGVVASALALREAGMPALDAIITGTGVGCIKDSEHFLQAILENDEQFLTPTSFIQSTHNTVGAQIALGLGCKAYNFSYVNGANSFEAALLDARLQMECGEASHILVGGVDEKADYTYYLFALAGLIKSEESSYGATYSEGAAFFTLGAEKTGNSYAALRGVEVYNRIASEKIQETCKAFLEKAQVSTSEIDVVVLGKNDDPRYQDMYTPLMEMFPGNIPTVHYKHLSGEFNTASAFGFWVATEILRSQHIADALLLKGGLRSTYRHVLLYNQYRGVDHSFVLLSQC